MATKTTQKKNTAQVMIPVYLQMLPDEGGSVQVDQNVILTINGVNKVVPRGVPCELTLDEYRALHDSGRFERL
jgi:hypothetical protein